MRLALAHDYLTQRGGAERVVLEWCREYPDAPLYTSVYNPAGTYEEFAEVDIRCSALQRFPPARRDPRLALPVLSQVWSRARVDDTDVLLVSSSGWAHGMVVGPEIPKVVYCHNPPRWLYQSEIYGTTMVERAAMSVLKPYLLRWDRKAAASAQVYIANSQAVAGRIRQAYGIEAEVVFPPVTIDSMGRQTPVDGISPGYFLTVGRGRGYKNVSRIVEAVGAIPGADLVVIGSDGFAPGERSAKHVRSLGIVSDPELRWLYANARALVTVAFEDFGLTPLEANSFGTPVAALRAGGHLDSVVEGVSGCWIEQPTTAAVKDTLLHFPDFDRAKIQEHAGKFSASAFRRRIDTVLESVK